MKDPQILLAQGPLKAKIRPWVQTHIGLREMLILQDIKNGLPVNLRIHLENCGISRLETAAFFADGSEM